MAKTANNPNTFYWSMDNDVVPLEKSWLLLIVEASISQTIPHIITYPTFSIDDYEKLDFKDFNGCRLAEIEPLMLHGHLMGIPQITFRNIGYFDLEHKRDPYLKNYTEKQILFGIEDTLYAQRVGILNGKIFTMEKKGVFKNIQTEYLDVPIPSADAVDSAPNYRLDYEKFKKSELKRLQQETLYEKLCDAYSSLNKPLKI